eukprot:633178-Pyramimonas_sp.AAC.1
MSLTRDSSCLRFVSSDYNYVAHAFGVLRFWYSAQASATCLTTTCLLPSADSCSSVSQSPLA